MMKSAIVRARIEPELKEYVEDVLEKVGLTTTDAIRLYFKQIALRGGIPFEVCVPNQETLQAVEMTERQEGLTEYKDAVEMFEKLGI